MPTKPQQRREYQRLIKRLREWRLEAGLSQRALSARMGRSITYASKVESRERRIDPAELAEWAKACGATGNNLLEAIGFST